MRPIRVRASSVFEAGATTVISMDRKTAAAVIRALTEDLSGIGTERLVLRSDGNEFLILKLEDATGDTDDRQ